MARLQILMGAGAALLLMTACERPSAVANKPAEPQAYASLPDNNGQGVSEAPDRRDEPVALVDGKPMWSSSRRGSAQENAQRSFERNGEDFATRDLEDFIKKAHAFVEDPPAGTQRLTRTNGDVLLYDPKGNVFAVVTKAGAPRTMFKPDEGQAYWLEQKDRQERRETARTERGARDDG